MKNLDLLQLQSRERHEKAELRKRRKKVCKKILKKTKKKIKKKKKGIDAELLKKMKRIKKTALKLNL